jgi:general L-amino acid transport system permease protein
MNANTVAVRWVRKNLLAGPMDAALTLVLVPLCIWAVYSFAHWALVGADWKTLEANMKVMLVGTFPPEMLNRAWYWFACLCGLTGATLGAVAPPTRRFIAVLSVVLAVSAVRAGLSNSAAFLNLTACTTLGCMAALLTGHISRSRKFIPVMWLLGFVASAYLLLPAGVDRWGGLMLGVMVTLISAALSIPIGFALAFGRRSKMAGIRAICIGYIEVMRSLPLILIVYWIWVVTPLVAPDYPVPDVVRGLLGFTFFFAAYVAEYVRSGLQAVPKGQVEAAASLGMTQGQINRDIVLPQALRVVTPALVGNVLDIFNNVPLLFIIGLTEFLRAGQMVLANPQSSGRMYEVYVFMFVVYLGAASLITYGARRVEARMASGYR